MSQDGENKINPGDTLEMPKATLGGKLSFDPTNQEQMLSPDAPEMFINRELSLLAFQRRVLEEAQDPANPLLERFKFLYILSSNIDEFFMVRIPGLKEQLVEGNKVSSADGLSPSNQLENIRREVNLLLRAARTHLQNDLLPQLQQAGVHIANYQSLSPKQKQSLRDLFLRSIFPVLTPLGFDPGHPFPHISGLSLNLAVLIKDRTGKEHFARVKVPDTLPQLIGVPSFSTPDSPDAKPGAPTLTYVWLFDLIKGNLDVLFPGMEVISAHCFHVTRDAEMEIQEWEAGDLLEETQKSINQRKFGDVVRLEVNHTMPAQLAEILVDNLEISSNDMYFVEGLIPLSNLKYLYNIDRSDLKYKPYNPEQLHSLDPAHPDEDIFAAIRQKDILLHHPYDSFDPVVDFVRQAANDPSVLAIKMTLYRVGKNSPVVQTLLQAIANGKQVAALVELKARFDESSNIEWAKALEAAGVHVVYGLEGLKVHCKAALVVRREGDAIRRYVHLGTGNYNPITAQIYTDLGLLTCDENIAADVSDLFNYLTGYSYKSDYKRLLVAPINLREGLENLITREIEHHKNGKQGRLIFKMNSLVDERIIKLFYKASQAGVKIDLIVRGICCLRPGVLGVSDNIRVTSIVHRFLEHSRIYYCHNGGDEQIYIGSADLMPRNLDRRVEVLFPLPPGRVFHHVKEHILPTYLADNVKSRIMQNDGTYLYPEMDPDSEQVFNSQKEMMKTGSFLAKLAKP